MPNRSFTELTMPPGKPGLSARGLKVGHLRLMAALGRGGQISRAAAELGMTQPAASRLAAEVQHIIGRAIYERTSRGVELTEAGRALALRAARALQEIDDAGREIAEMGRTLTGEVRIGAVTGPALEHVLPVLRSARLSLPGVTIAVEVATSDILCAHLLDGRIDLALGRLSGQGDLRDITLEAVSKEPMRLVVRPDHPLLRSAPISAEELVDYQWVLPFEGAVLRTAVAETLRRRGLNMPPNIYVTSSFLLTLALVRETNAIAPVAAAVASTFGGDGGTVRVLPTELELEVETYGLMSRRGRRPTPAVSAVSALLRHQIGLA